ncbi:MAG: hypothetical protein A2921_00350 [Candidatus Magasanikbacteria bacterium RIFCSPLOWO2_01_FULL_43_20b]|uniref:Uncharacterized protein n=1 Tax=Candidatus Magasanikbacteria bacterium RIFCSPLOWO2_12_FULL_43_12 TaxID=1798692 RepID=A0A1F6MRV8_9BACT|nr:MAG: hypothetical protein A3I93_01080 [Candidatus Magasanikbacteria bacterium RIFCSPLOWO2_02_FULL_43_22]OGH73188.1 MAG: hypothetical protein A2921_00350 [Candidatus Magasanikbacteria bacterium RIFCSPLOWO2_01_FULL_43_20b]OGH74396.1 MAG: hypothetical protein A3G00_04460 [Candidatus Magasanikbacteria bacterium RIFCSPLOWO2_12_FULL_43_12]
MTKPEKLVEVDKDGAVSFTFDEFSDMISDDLAAQRLYCATDRSCNSSFFSSLHINTEPIDSEDVNADKLRQQ